MKKKCECISDYGFFRHEIISNKCVECGLPIFESVEVVE